MYLTLYIDLCKKCMLNFFVMSLSLSVSLTHSLIHSLSYTHTHTHTHGIIDMLS